MSLPQGKDFALSTLMDQSLATPGMVMKLESPARLFQTPSAVALPAAPTLEPEELAPADRLFLQQLQKQALQYFVDNQTANGLILDRQRNWGPPTTDGLCSTTATGMGLIALAVASAPPFQVLSPSHAGLRIRTALETVLYRLPHDHGVMPHFVDSASGRVHGVDQFSTIETAWLLAGALWAGSFLQDPEVERLAGQLYDRVDWHYWTAPEQVGGGGLVRHGKGPDGRFLASSWDRLNGETAFMYVLGAGAAKDKNLSASAWAALQPYYGSIAGIRFNNADLGLFVFQYGLDLLDLEHWRAPGTTDLIVEAQLATIANQRVCRQAAFTFATYRTYWGLSAGDGPGDPPESDTYRCYAPSGPIDGTSHITATLAAVAHSPAAVLENLRQAQHDRELPAHGRYGFSNLNVDRSWIGRDMVGIDAGAAVLALDNYLMQGRVRTVFSSLSCVRLGMERLGFVPLLSSQPDSRTEEPVQTVRQAS
jgi:hypothetical protein